MQLVEYFFNVSSDEHQIYEHHAGNQTPLLLLIGFPEDKKVWFVGYQPQEYQICIRSKYAVGFVLVVAGELPLVFNKLHQLVLPLALHPAVREYNLEIPVPNIILDKLVDKLAGLVHEFCPGGDDSVVPHFPFKIFFYWTELLVF